jgi:hypothetical protein
VSLANTQEALFIVNRPARRPSSEGAAAYFDRAAALCRQAGFRDITFRGDTDFTQAAHLDRWDADGIRFIFGLDAQPNLVSLAQRLPERVWQPLPRRSRHEMATAPRRRRPGGTSGVSPRLAVPYRSTSRHGQERRATPAATGPASRPRAGLRAGPKARARTSGVWPDPDTRPRPEVREGLATADVGGPFARKGLPIKGLAVRGREAIQFITPGHGHGPGFEATALAGPCALIPAAGAPHPHATCNALAPSRCGRYAASTKWRTAPGGVHVLVRRGAKVYLYRYEKHNGRSRRVYVACGPDAERAHADDLRRRDQRQALAKAWQDERERLEGIDDLVAGLTDATQALARAHLLLEGLRRHERGHWRRRRGARPN